MSWKTASHKTYEQRVVNDSIARLGERVDVKGLPFSDQELKTLAKRSRESFRHPEKKREQLVRHKAYLAKSYGADLVEEVSAALEEISNAIGHEEK